MNHVLRSLWPWLLAILVILGIQLTIAPSLDPYIYTILMYAGINAILAVSLNLVNGFTGQFSMGHAGFMAVGGYVSAVVTQSAPALFPELTSYVGADSLVFIIALLLGGAGAGLAGLVVGLPSLRLKGDYLAIVTLGFGEIIRVVLLNMDVVGGARGLPNIAPYANFGWVYSGVVFTLFVIWRVVHSNEGRALLAVREDEIAAESMGVFTTRTKVRAFVLGAFFAGIAGGFFAHYLRYLNPSIFDLNRSFEVIIMVVFGGMGSITGSVLAAFFLTFIREALRPLQEITKVDLRMIIYALVLIALMLTRPHGLFGRFELPTLLQRFKKKSKETR